MRERLQLPEHLDGNLWRYAHAASQNVRHTHAELEFNLVTRGAGTYLLGNRRYQIRRGDLLWLFPSQEHVLFEQSPDFEMWVAVFRRRAVRRAALDSDTSALLQKQQAQESCRRLTPPDMKRLEDLLAELVEASAYLGTYNAGLTYLVLRAWRSFQRAGEVPVRDLHPAVERAAHLIRDNPAQHSLHDLAHRAGLSPSRLSRLFKEQTGFPMVEFRNRQRTERFLSLYGTGQRKSMLNAALDAGFGSYPQFHRVFTRVIGCSPAEYRRNLSA